MNCPFCNKKIEEEFIQLTVDSKDCRVTGERGGRMKNKEKKKIENKTIYWSDTNKTLDAWTGGGFYDRLWQLDLFGFRVVFWRAPKYIDISKEEKEEVG